MAKKATAKKAQLVEVPGLKLDIGCGPNKKEGFIGVDKTQFGSVDQILDAGRHTWPWKDGSVEEVHCSHMIEHLEWPERVHFFNELYRVLKKGGKATIILPHWCSHRFYGDPTHKAPFSEMAWLYMNKEWRLANAPHADSEKAPGPLAYSCDFDSSYGFSIAPWMVGRSKEFVDFALAAYKEAAQDMMCTLMKNR
jgi:hypothetical protein